MLGKVAFSRITYRMGELHVAPHVSAAVLHRNDAVDSRMQRPEIAAPASIVWVAWLTANFAVAVAEPVR